MMQISHPRAYFEPGDIVMALLLGKSYRSAIISEIYDSGKIRIEWCNLDEREALREMKDIIFLDRPPRTTSNQDFDIGEHVEAFSVTSGKYHYSKVLERREDTYVRIKRIEHEDSKEGVKPVHFIRKIQNWPPETEEYSSSRPVLALDMQTLAWRSATVLKVIRPNVFQIGWEKSTEVDAYSAPTQPYFENVFKHISHLQPFFSERFEKEGFLYATLGKICTYGLPKQGLLNYRREYSLLAGTAEFELTRPPNFLRSDPACFFEDSMKKMRVLEYQTELSEAEGFDSNPESFHTRHESENSAGVSSYIFSKDKEGFEQLWDAFRPGDMIQVFCGGDAEMTSFWSVEGRILKRENRKKNESIHFQIQWVNGKKEKLKIAYKLSQRSAMLRKKIQAFSENYNQGMAVHSPHLPAVTNVQKIKKLRKETGSLNNERHSKGRGRGIAVAATASTTSKNEKNKKRGQNEKENHREISGSGTIEFMLSGGIKRVKHQQA